MAKRVFSGGDASGSEPRGKERKKELDLEDKRMNMIYGDARRLDKGVPIACDCGARVHVGTDKPNTTGKLYFTCPYEISVGPGKGCGFRRGFVPAVLDEFEKLKRDNYEMKQELEATKKLLHEQDLTIFEMDLEMEELKKAKGKQQADPDADTVVGTLMSKFDTLEIKFAELEEKYESLDMYLD